MIVAAPVSAQQAADSIWSGGPILTMNDKAMRAEAVAVADGKILAVGSAQRGDEAEGPRHAAGRPGRQNARSRLRRRPRPRRHRRAAGAVGQPAGPARRQGARHRLAAADAARLGPGQRRRRREDEAHHRLRLRQRAARGTAPPHQGRTRRGIAGHPDPDHPPVLAPGDGQLRHAEGHGLRRQQQGSGGRRHPAQARQQRAQRHAWRRPRSSPACRWCWAASVRRG